MKNLENQILCKESLAEISKQQTLDQNLDSVQSCTNDTGDQYNYNKNISNTLLVDVNQSSLLNSDDKESQSQKAQWKSFVNTSLLYDQFENLRESNPEIPKAMQNDEVSVNDIQSQQTEEENINDKNEYGDTQFMNYSNSEDNDIIELTKSSIINSRITHHVKLNSITKHTFESDMEIENIHDDLNIKNSQAFKQNTNDQIIQIIEDREDLKDENLVDSNIIYEKSDEILLNQSSTAFAFENLEDCSNVLHLTKEKIQECLSKEDSMYFDKNLTKTYTSHENTIISHIDLNRKSSENIIPQLNNHYSFHSNKNSKDTLRQSQSQANHYLAKDELENKNLEMNQEKPVLSTDNCKFALQKSEDDKLQTTDYTLYDKGHYNDNNECLLELKDKIHDMKDQINTPYKNFAFTRVSTDFSVYNPNNEESNRSSLIAKFPEGDNNYPKEIIPYDFVTTRIKNSNNFAKKTLFDQFEATKNTEVIVEDESACRLTNIREIDIIQNSPENALSRFTENKVISTDVGFFSPPVSSHDRVLNFNKDQQLAYNCQPNNQTYQYTNNDFSLNTNTAFNSHIKNKVLLINSSNKKKQQINESDSDEINFKKNQNDFQTDLNYMKFHQFIDTEKNHEISPKDQISCTENNINTIVSPSAGSELENFYNLKIVSKRDSQKFVDDNLKPGHRANKSCISTKKDNISDADQTTSNFYRTQDSNNNFKLINSAETKIGSVQNTYENGKPFLFILIQMYTMHSRLMKLYF